MPGLQSLRPKDGRPPTTAIENPNPREIELAVDEAAGPHINPEAGLGSDPGVAPAEPVLSKDEQEVYDLVRNFAVDTAFKHLSERQLPAEILQAKNTLEDWDKLAQTRFLEFLKRLHDVGFNLEAVAVAKGIVENVPN